MVGPCVRADISSLNHLALRYDNRRCEYLEKVHCLFTISHNASGWEVLRDEGGIEPVLILKTSYSYLLVLLHNLLDPPRWEACYALGRHLVGLLRAPRRKIRAEGKDSRKISKSDEFSQDSGLLEAARMNNFPSKAKARNRERKNPKDRVPERKLAETPFSSLR